MSSLIRFLLALSCLGVTLPLLAEDAKNAFNVTTSAFLDEGILPVLYTCDGKDISPQLAWANPPDKTKSFAVIASDPMAPKGTFYHWLLFNVPAKTTEIDEGMKTVIKGAVLGKNDFGKEQYNGPCPPKGTAHTYIFTVYALDSTLPLKAGAASKEVIAAMQKHIVGQTKLTAVYSRWTLQ